MLTIYLTRHGQTEWNVMHRMQGWGNGELTELGITGAKKLSTRLKDIHLDKIYSSTSKRAYLTAEIIKDHRNVPLIKDDVFREMCFGDWDGQFRDDIISNYPDDFHAFWETPHTFDRSKFGCETFAQLKERVQKALQMIVDQNEEGTILVVAHSIFLRMLLAIIKQMPINDIFKQNAPANTSLTKVIYDGQNFIIEYESDTSHDN